jgi:hypothetical protein
MTGASETPKGRDYGAGEGDVADDAGVASSRESGGDADESAADTNSTTGTTPNDEFVGRTSGQDTGYEGETGAEARAE